MPDITLVVQNLSDPDDAEKLERALARLDSVNLANVDADKSLIAVSYEGGETELQRIEEAVREAGYDFEPSPGADQLER